ncbi:MAG TPA: hypothetical protein DCZ80_06400 [Legionellales bacterium]|nr:hypothetical protein [Legionellales bacterium]
MIKKFITIALIFHTLMSFAKNTCQDIGGQVQKMEMIYNTPQGLIKGFSRPFCTFVLDHGFAVIGLESMNSKKANIAASMVLSLSALDEQSKLWEGSDTNPAHNVCRNLGGTYAQLVTNGSFQSQEGANDICVFGDGSMISGWTLIYIANQREGYDLIKNNIPSQALFSIF